MISRFFIFLFIFPFFFFGAPSMFAQDSNPQPVRSFLMSWEADSYVPHWYMGKILPSRETRITVSMELLEDGRVVDITNMKVNWLVNGKLLSTALGQHVFSFVTTNQHREEYEITARIEVGDGVHITHDVVVPRVIPEIIIDAPFPDNVFRSSQISIQALPYFFPIRGLSELIFSWDVNGIESDNARVSDSFLTISIPNEIDRASVVVRLFAQLASDPSYTIRSPLHLTFAR